MKTNPELVEEIAAITRATIELNALLSAITMKPFKRTAMQRWATWTNVRTDAEARRAIASEGMATKKPRKEKTSEKTPTVTSPV